MLTSGTNYKWMNHTMLMDGYLSQTCYACGMEMTRSVVDGCTWQCHSCDPNIVLPMELALLPLPSGEEAIHVGDAMETDGEPIAKVEVGGAENPTANMLGDRGALVVYGSHNP